MRLQEKIKQESAVGWQPRPLPDFPFMHTVMDPAKEFRHK